MALLIILVMLLLGVIVAMYYLPRPQKPFRIHKDYSFEASHDITPRVPILDAVEKRKSKIDYRLPDKYNADQICLMVRDPQWLFGFWEISQATRENLESQYGPNFFYETRQILRVYNISEAGDSTSYMDIHIDDGVRRWHFAVDKPDSRFYIAIGRMLANGHFIPILISNTIQMPRASVSLIIDENWPPYFDKNHQLYKNGYPYSSSSMKERID